MLSDSTEVETLEISEGGNTITPSDDLEPKKQTVQRLHWCFTWNNYPIEAIEILEHLLTHICYDYAFQEEVGASGTKHLQGVLSAKKRCRWTEFGLPKGIHWEPCKVVTAAYDYCTRISKRADGGRVWTLKYKVPKVIKCIKPEQFYDWEKQVVELIMAEPDDRTIIWIYSHQGKMGKSSFCKYLAMKHRAIIAGKGSYSDICNLVYKSDLDSSDLIVFDLPRNNGNRISYSALEAIKNGMICNTKYETGSILFNPPHILIFSNVEPDYEAMSIDRFKVINVDC